MTHPILDSLWQLRSDGVGVDLTLVAGRDGHEEEVHSSVAMAWSPFIRARERGTGDKKLGPRPSPWAWSTFPERSPNVNV